jgi:hypothetical protein
MGTRAQDIDVGSKERFTWQGCWPLCEVVQMVGWTVCGSEGGFTESRLPNWRRRYARQPVAAAAVADLLALDRAASERQTADRVASGLRRRKSESREGFLDAGLTYKERARLVAADHDEA